MAIAVPFGFHFRPLAEELLYFLLARVMEESFPWDQYPILDCDLYGNQTPSEIFTNPNEKIWYCFTRLKKTSRKRVSRVAGNGTWHGETSAVEIRGHDSINNNKIIGFKKTFAFKIKGVRDNRTSWIMHEYSLQESCDLVLCVIKKKTKASRGEHQEPNITYTPSNNLLEDEVHADDLVGVTTTSSSIFSNGDQPKLQPQLSGLTEILRHDDSSFNDLQFDSDFLNDDLDFNFEV